VCPEAADLAAFAVNNLGALCDALEASAARIAELKADRAAVAAAMGIKRAGLDDVEFQAVIEERAPTATALTVAELQRESYDTACAKGWHDEDRGPVSPAVHEIALAGLRIASTCDDIEAVRKGADPRRARRSMMLTGVNHWQVRALSWLALVCTEAAEAMDDVLAERWSTTMREDGKPEGLGSELADIIIRVCDTAGAMGLDMEAELRAKMAFNRTRSHKHGGKLA